MVNLSEKIIDFNLEALFNLLTDNSSDLVAILNEKFKFEYINSKTHENLTGYTEKDLLLKPVSILIYPKDRKKAINKFKTIFREGEDEGQIRLKHINGDFIWVILKGKTFLDYDNKIKILVISKKITLTENNISSKSEDRFKEMCDNLTEIRLWKFLQPKQAIVAYQETQEMLKLIMNSIPQYITWKDKNLIYMGCNSNFIKLLGMKDEKDIIGKTDFDLGWEKENIIQTQMSEKKIIKSDISQYHVTESWKYDDKQTWFNINRIPLHNLRGDVVGILITYDDITEQKESDEELKKTIKELIEANKKLKESEEKYRDLTELLPETIYEVDLDYNITYVNSSGLRKFGYTQEDLKQGIKIFEAFPPEELNNLKKNIENIFASKNLEPHEYKMLKKDSSQIFVRTNSVPIYKDGKIAGIRGVILDITESKLAEQKLKESEEKFKSLFKGSPNFTIAWRKVNDEFVLSDYNDYAELISKKDVIERIGQTASDMLLREFKRPDLFENIYKCFEEKQNFSKEINFYVNFIDENRDLIAKYTYIPPDSVLCHFDDITRRKRSEIVIHESEKKYRLLSENANDLIYSMNHEGKFFSYNEAFKKTLGYSSEEIKNITPLEISHPDDKNYLVESYKKLLKAGSGINEARFKCKNGSYIWLETTSNITYDDEGKPTRIFCVSRNNTERKIMEEKLIKSEEKLKILNRELEQKVKERTKELEKKNIELQKLDKIKDEFITKAAHELKTPLISIAGYTDYILHKHQDLNPEIKEDLLIVQRNIDRLHNLMNELLDVMKIESHKMDLKKKLVNINKIIKNCINELSYLIKEKNHNIFFNIKEDIYLKIDPERIFQVFSNLLSNAIKFTPNNGKIEIIAEENRSQKHYVFKIKDNGIGLNKEDLNKLFKKFEIVNQISDGKYKKGTGLGLYISKGFVEAHDGNIWANSEGLNKGTTISFTLPI